MHPVLIKFKQAILKKWRESEWAQNLQAKLQGFEVTNIIEWANKIFKKQNAGFYGTLLTIILAAYFTADLTAMLLGKFVPEPPLARMASPIGQAQAKTKTFEDYGIIFTRNLFNSQGLIPGDDAPAVPGVLDLGSPPIKSTLPFNLIGTLILKDEIRSIATIEDKSASIVYPVRVSDEIPSKARILKIEPQKVIFLNVSSGRREFIELPEDAPSTVPRITIGSARSTGAPSLGIEQSGNNQFNISKNEVDKSLADLNNILTQARAVPNFENGVANGYKLFQIVPGSIYDKLGLKNDDVITGLNGEAINDPGKAFELLSQLKTSSHLEMQVKRGGRASTFVYDIR